jgi:hypothetical protein
MKNSNKIKYKFVQYFSSKIIFQLRLLNSFSYLKAELPNLLENSLKNKAKNQKVDLCLEQIILFRQIM